MSAREYTALEREAQTTRMHELWAHFREAGCCHSCSMTFALILVSREWGEASDLNRLCHSPRPKCKELANAARATVPKAAKAAA